MIFATTFVLTFLLFEGHVWHPVKFVLFSKVIEILDVEKFLIIISFTFTTVLTTVLATVLEVSATVAMVFIIVIIILMSPTLTVLSRSLLLVGTSLHMLHHLVELGWEDKMNRGHDHEDEGEECKAA